MPDPLESVLPFNRFDFVVRSESKRAVRYMYFFSLLMVEPDQDEYKELLPKVARLIMQSVRNSDLIGQDGGDRLMLILHDAEKPSAFEVGERIRSEVEGQNIVLENRSDRLTVSVGGACFPTDETHPDGLFSTAKQMLEHARRLDGNRVCFPEM